MSPRDTSEGRGPASTDRHLRDVPFTRFCVGHARAVAAPNESANGRLAGWARWRSRPGGTWRCTVRHVVVLCLCAPPGLAVPSQNNRPAAAPRACASCTLKNLKECARNHARAPRKLSGTGRASVAEWSTGRSNRRVNSASPPVKYARRRAAPSPREHSTTVMRSPTSDPHSMAVRALTEPATVVRACRRGGRGASTTVARGGLPVAAAANVSIWCYGGARRREKRRRDRITHSACALLGCGGENHL